MPCPPHALTVTHVFPRMLIPNLLSTSFAPPGSCPPLHPALRSATRRRAATVAHAVEFRWKNMKIKNFHEK